MEQFKYRDNFLGGMKEMANKLGFKDDDFFGFLEKNNWIKIFDFTSFECLICSKSFNFSQFDHLWYHQRESDVTNENLRKYVRDQGIELSTKLIGCYMCKLCNSILNCKEVTILDHLDSKAHVTVKNILQQNVTDKPEICTEKASTVKTSVTHCNTKEALESENIEKNTNNTTTDVNTDISTQEKIEKIALNMDILSVAIAQNTETIRASLQQNDKILTNIVQSAGNISESVFKNVETLSAAIVRNAETIAENAEKISRLSDKTITSRIDKLSETVESFFTAFLAKRCPSELQQVEQDSINVLNNNETNVIVNEILSSENAKFKELPENILTGIQKDFDTQINRNESEFRTVPPFENQTNCADITSEARTSNTSFVGNSEKSHHSSASLQNTSLSTDRDVQETGRDFFAINKISKCDQCYRCGICNVTIYGNIFNMFTHMIGFKHLECITDTEKYLNSQGIFTVESKCTTCKKSFTNAFDHLYSNIHMNKFSKFLNCFIEKNPQLLRIHKKHSVGTIYYNNKKKKLADAIKNQEIENTVANEEISKQNDKEYLTERYLHSNRIVHVSAKRYKCHICNVLLSGKNNITQHVNGSNHRQGLNCDDSVFLDMHGVLKIGQKILCRFCDEEIHDMDSALNHIHTVKHRSVIVNCLITPDNDDVAPVLDKKGREPGVIINTDELTINAAKKRNRRRATRSANKTELKLERKGNLLTGKESSDKVKCSKLTDLGILIPETKICNSVKDSASAPHPKNNTCQEDVLNENLQTPLELQASDEFRSLLEAVGISELTENQNTFKCSICNIVVERVSKVLRHLCHKNHKDNLLQQTVRAQIDSTTEYQNILGEVDKSNQFKSDRQINLSIHEVLSFTIKMVLSHKYIRSIGGLYRCSKCELNFINTFDCYEHIKDEMHENRYEESSCNKDLSNHTIVIDDLNDTYQCWMCDESIKTFPEVQEHIESDSHLSLKTHQADFILTYSGVSIKPFGSSYKCEKCQQEFAFLMAVKHIDESCSGTSDGFVKFDEEECSFQTHESENDSVDTTEITPELFIAANILKLDQAKSVYIVTPDGKIFLKSDENLNIAAKKTNNIKSKSSEDDSQDSESLEQVNPEDCAVNKTVNTNRITIYGKTDINDISRSAFMNYVEENKVTLTFIATLDGKIFINNA